MEERRQARDALANLLLVERGEAEQPAGAPRRPRGVADIANFVFVNAATTLGAAPPAELVNVNGWLTRVAGRPAVKAETEAMLAYAQRALSSGSA